MAHVHELNTDYPTDCPFVLAVRDKYSDWRYTMDYGYIRYHIGSAVLFEHKLVAELIHGPKPDGWHTHHIDGNRANNVWYNLAQLSPSQHSKIHAPSQSMHWCDYCGNEFWRHRSAVERANKSYCSVACSHKGQFNHRRPSKHELKSILDDVRNFCEVGRMFGVSDNAVRKWAKIYELDFAHVDGRRK